MHDDAAPTQMRCPTVYHPASARAVQRPGVRAALVVSFPSSKHYRGMVRIGVDTGGTFTDFVCLDERGLRVHKVRSTPADPSQAILEGVRALLGDAGGWNRLEVTHGSTVATNAVLERRGAKVALLTTAGFEDVLRIGRQTRPELYNFQVQRPEPLVSRDLTFRIGERVAADGSVLEPLCEADIDTAIRVLKEQAVESAAVCFLHSYRNPDHEAKAAERLRAAGLLVSASHEVLPEYREFERWSTTAMNAYVAPLMARYLGRLQEGLQAGSLRVMQSNGGLISAQRASREAVQTIMSGPAGGVVGARHVGAASGFERLITFDMGGTSTDVSLIDGAIGTTNESLVGDLPLRLPVLDIHTVGAGGGSVAWIDAGGGLRVGPRSAGANPGPVCFGVGDELTVTDANLLLGRLDPEYFLGGRMSLDLPRTVQVAEAFAARLGMAVPELARGIVQIANANMERAVRVVSVQRGHDPRDFCLLAFGGAGGLHACDLAASLEIGTVLVPQHAGVLSALGMLLADVVKDYSASLLSNTADLNAASLVDHLERLLLRARADLQSEGFAAKDMELSAALATRYKGQAFEIDVPLDLEGVLSEQIGGEALRSSLDTFHQRHERSYGYSRPERATEVVQLRVRAVGRTVKARFASGHRSTSLAARPSAVRSTLWWHGPADTAIFHRDQLEAGMGGPGPAIVISGEATTLVPPGWTWQMDAAGTLVARAQRGGRHAA